MGRMGEVSWDVSYLPRTAFFTLGNWIASSETFLIPTGKSINGWRCIGVTTTWTFLGVTLTRTARR